MVETPPFQCRGVSWILVHMHMVWPKIGKLFKLSGLAQEFLPVPWWGLSSCQALLPTRQCLRGGRSALQEAWGQGLAEAPRWLEGPPCWALEATRETAGGEAGPALTAHPTTWLPGPARCGYVPAGILLRVL